LIPINALGLSQLFYIFKTAVLTERADAVPQVQLIPGRKACSGRATYRKWPRAERNGRRINPVNRPFEPAGKALKLAKPAAPDSPSLNLSVRSLRCKK
jgi:hypothetical protein